MYSLLPDSATRTSTQEQRVFNPCENGGICRADVDASKGTRQLKCKCVPPYSGMFCEILGALVYDDEPTRVVYDTPGTAFTAWAQTVKSVAQFPSDPPLLEKNNYCSIMSILVCAIKGWWSMGESIRHGGHIKHEQSSGRNPSSGSLFICPWLIFRVKNRNFRLLGGRYLMGTFLSKQFCEQHTCTTRPRLQIYGTVVRVHTWLRVLYTSV